MKPVPLNYVVPSSVEEAVAVLHEGGGEARPIAGGQSLIPLLNLRLATPATLVDVARLPELAGVTVGGSSIVLGAAVTHSDVEHSKELAHSLPLLPFVAGHIGHPPIRVRGTLGGSLAHGDPAAEWPTVMALLDATVLAQGVTGAGEFLLATSALPSSRPFSSPTRFSSRSRSRSLPTAVDSPSPSSPARREPLPW